MSEFTISLAIDGVTPVTDGAEISNHLIGYTNRFVDAVKRFFKPFSINLTGTTRITSSSIEVKVTIDESTGLVPSASANLPETIRTISSKFSETLSGLETACNKNAPSPTGATGASVLAIDKAAWDLAPNSHGIQICVAETCVATLMLRDPQTLRSIRQSGVIETVITGRLVKGARIISEFNMDFFPELDLDRDVDVIITLDGDVTEIWNRMTIRAYLDLFSGLLLLSARVCGKQGEIPKVDKQISTTKIVM